MPYYTDEDLKRWPILLAEFGALVNYRKRLGYFKNESYEEGSGIYEGRWNYDGPIIYVRRPDGVEVKLFLDMSGDSVEVVMP